jgi:tRNA (guanine-N7-)-methyltransferase
VSPFTLHNFLSQSADCTFFYRPLRPDKYDWRMQYPTNEDSTRRLSDPQVKFVDVGCGFGGLLVKIAPVFPEHFAIGFEIRDKVSQYVKERCKALRKCNHGLYEKISCIRTNSMKFLPNYFRKGQLSKLFFLFPDPHFKTANHRRRIIQRNLLAEYAYALHNGGLLYTITDVEELGSWMADKISAHPCFRQLNSDEIQNDQVVPILFTGTEEGTKVKRNEGTTYLRVFKRVTGPI